MDDQTKKDFIELFNQGFEDVVLPHIERIDSKLEVIEDRLEVVELKLDKGIGQQLESKQKLEEYDKRLKKLESKKAIAA